MQPSMFVSMRDVQMVEQLTYEDVDYAFKPLLAQMRKSVAEPRYQHAGCWIVDPAM